jgi:ABC-type spermidine/putrescine transport system permease subunit I
LRKMIAYRAGGPKAAATDAVQWVAYSGLLPSTLFLVLFFVLPLMVTLSLSLSPNVLIQFVGLGLGNFRYLLSKAYYADVLLHTLNIAGLTTIIALSIGYPAAYSLKTISTRISGMLVIFLALPILSGPLVVVLGWMILLPDGGPLFRPLIARGLIGPLHLIGTETAIVIALVHFTVPFVILTLYSSFKQIPNDLLEAARSLGAGGIGTFLGVIWPLSLPGVISASLIAFSLAASAYVAPYYLGGPTQMTLTTLVGEFILGTYNSEMAATVAVVLLISMGVIVFAFTKITSRFVR